MFLVKRLFVKTFPIPTEVSLFLLKSLDSFFEEGEGTGTSVGGRRRYQCRKGHTVTLVLSAVFTFPSRGYWSGGNRSSGQCCFRPSPKAALSCPNIRKVGGGTRASQALGDGSSGAVLKWLCLFVFFFLALKVKNLSVK